MVFVLMLAVVLAACLVVQWWGAKGRARRRGVEAVRRHRVDLGLADGAGLEARIARQIRGGATGAMVGLVLGTLVATYWIRIDSFEWPEMSGLVIVAMTMVGLSLAAGAVGESWVAARSAPVTRGSRRVARLERRDPLRYVHPRERLTVAAMLAVVVVVAVPGLAQGGRTAQATVLLIAAIACVGTSAWWAARRVVDRPAVAEDRARAMTSDLLTRDTMDRLLEHVTNTVWLATLYTGLLGNDWMNPALAFGVTLVAAAGGIALWSARERRHAPAVASP